MASYLGLHEKICKMPNDGLTWYNLETNRKITVMKDKVGLTYPPVAASNFNIIAEFIETNSIGPREIKYMRPEHEYELRQEMLARKNPQKLVAPIPTNDIEDVSQDEINSLDLFSLTRIHVKAKIIPVSYTHLQPTRPY